MDRIQFIAYQIRTALKEPDGRRHYPGLPDPSLDLDARCRILLDAIEEAGRHGRIDPQALKVFAAPEFFFRGGRGGAYEIDVAARIHEHLDPVLSDRRYRNWIFFPGTVVACMPERQPNRREVVNFCPVRKGGVRICAKETGDGKDAELAAVVVNKEFLSYCDFLGPHHKKDAFFESGTAGKVWLHGREIRIQPISGARPTEGGDVALEGAGRPNLPEMCLQGRRGESLSSEFSPSGMGGGGRFFMNGVDFLSEICVDHNQGRLGVGDERSGRLPHVQIVISCGINPCEIRCREKGYFFHVDGYDDGAHMVVLKRKVRGRGMILNPDLAMVSVSLDRPQAWTRYEESGKVLFESGRGALYISESLELPR